MKERKFAAVLLAGALGLTLAAPALTIAQTAQVKYYPGFKPTKNSLGQPDISGSWSNATITDLERPAEYGERLVMTPQELAKVEAAEAEYIAEGNKPTDPKLTVSDLPVNCGRGFSGTNCGYNRGWTDPGSTVMRVGGEPRTSFLTTPNGRVPPAKTAAGRGTALAAAAGRGGAAAGRRASDNPETQSLGVRCLTSFGASAGPVMQPLLYNNTYEIVQSRDSVAILVEMVHDVRIVRLNAKHRTDGVRPWYGDSIGWYEGDTLVVETTNFPQRNAFRGSWENLKLTEKFTRVAPDRLLYRFTIEDPTRWDRSFGGEYEFAASKNAYEYACHEGNYALEGILAGARNEEAIAAAGGSQGRTGAAPAGVSAR